MYPILSNPIADFWIRQCDPVSWSNPLFKLSLTQIGSRFFVYLMQLPIQLNYKNKCLKQIKENGLVVALFPSKRENNEFMLLLRPFPFLNVLRWNIKKCTKCQKTWKYDVLLILYYIDIIYDIDTFDTSTYSWQVRFHRYMFWKHWCKTLQRRLLV